MITIAHLFFLSFRQVHSNAENVLRMRWSRKRCDSGMRMLEPRNPFGKKQPIRVRFPVGATIIGPKRVLCRQTCPARRAVQTGREHAAR